MLAAAGALIVTGASKLVSVIVKVRLPTCDESAAQLDLGKLVGVLVDPDFGRGGVNLDLERSGHFGLGFLARRGWR